MKRAIAIAAAIAAPAIMLAACDNGGTDQTSGGDVTFTGTTDPGTGFPLDPYSNNGVWRIPDQVQPGLYAVTPNADSVVSLRWLVLCRDEYCQDHISETVRYANESGGPIYYTIPGDGSVKAYLNNGVKLSTPR